MDPNRFRVRHYLLPIKIVSFKLQAALSGRSN